MLIDILHVAMKAIRVQDLLEALLDHMKEMNLPMSDILLVVPDSNWEANKHVHICPPMKTLVLPLFPSDHHNQ